MIWNAATMLDVAILLLLAATVFFAFRLTLSLRQFKEGRDEMEGLVNRLTATIEQAEKAVGGMQNAARRAGLELDEVIHDSKKLADELRMMNEMGNHLADRLEKLADRNRQAPEPIRYNNEVRPVSHVKHSSSLPDFILQDRDFDDPGFMIDEEGGDAAGGFQSQAERELFEALQSGKTRPRGRA